MLKENLGNTNSWRRSIEALASGMNTVAIAVILFMMSLTVLDVALRYFLRRPILGCTEIVAYMMVSLALACPKSVIMGRTVRTGMLMGRLSSFSQIAIEAFTESLGTTVMWFLSIQLFREAKFVYMERVSTSILSIPSFPFVIVLGLSMAVLSVILSWRAVEAIKRLLANGF